jgi:hypothetical protein
MQKTLLALSVAAGIGLVGSQSAGAVPASATAVKEAAPVSVLLQPAQYTERRTGHGVVKCYRDFVVGPYRCHYYRNP